MPNDSNGRGSRCTGRLKRYLATKFLNTLRHEFQVAMALTGGVACPNVGWMTGHPEAGAVRLSDEKSSLPPRGRATLLDKYWPNIQDRKSVV